MRNPLRAVLDLSKPQATYYKGASFDRLNYDWYMWRLSADQQLKFDLQMLRSRARELVANNSTAAGISEAFVENVVGKDGIRLEAQVELQGKSKGNSSVNQQINEEWQEWCEQGNCTVDGRDSLAEAQAMWMRTEVIDGETLLYHIHGFDNPWGYAIDTIDVDQLDHMYNITGTDTTNAIRMGVEQDFWHRPVAYWLWTKHPSEPEGKARDRFDARMFTHVFRSFRPKASRCATWYAPVIFDLNMMGGYRDATITAARVGASTMGFFKPGPDAQAMEDPNGKRKPITMHVEPGLMQQLPYDMSVDMFKPEYPQTAYEKFEAAILRSIATAMRVSYMTASGDLNNTSFASGRIGLAAEQEVYRGMQMRFIRRFMTPIYRRWIGQAMLTRRLKLPSLNPQDYYDVAWHPRALPWLDPQKDLETAERSVAMGIDSLTRLCASQGRSFEDVIKQRAQEMEIAEREGVPIILSSGRAKPLNVDITQEAEQDKAGEAGEPPDEQTDNGQQDDDNGPPRKKKALLLRRVAP